MIRDALRPLKPAAAGLPWRLGAALGLWRGEGAPVQFVIENADWAIRWVGEHVRDAIEPIAPGAVEVALAPQRITGRLVHFGSQYMWLHWRRHMPRGNRYVTSFFHGKPEDGPDVARHIERFLDSAPALDHIVTGAGIVERRLLDWGVPRERLSRIPIGVDTAVFTPSTPEQRRGAREALGVGDDRLLVGSFQKDGVGWGDGMAPKRIKGPDILVDALAELSRHHPVTALLTGPARGFVKQGLEKIGVPFVHRYVPRQRDLVACYHALDLYLVSSREEGGPMGLMESMASGVPVASTPVGMAPDLITHGETGALSAAEDAVDLAEKALALIDDAGRRDALRDRAREAVMVADWATVGRRHWREVYQPLLAR